MQRSAFLQKHSTQPNRVLHLHVYSTYYVCASNSLFLLLDSHVSLPGLQHTDGEDKIDFGGSNVHVITSKENWDQKIEEANKDGKIVSKTNLWS